MFELSNEYHHSAKIKVIGVGGGGGNAVNTMIRQGMKGVDFIAANTDMQVLTRNKAPYKIQLGAKLTKGLGAGANPDIGREAAIEDEAKIKEALTGADMIFITAGMGGGTGTGASPVIAEIAKSLGALVVAVVTKPFEFEGKKRASKAEKGIDELSQYVDTLIVIPNDRLFNISDSKTTILEAYSKVDEVLVHAVRGISDIITIPGLVNVDFADVKTVMSEMGMAMMGTGKSNGEKRAREAAQEAISNPLLEDISIAGAKGVLINITGDASLTLNEVKEACELVKEQVDENANVIYGTVIDENIGDNLNVTVIATGFGERNVKEKYTNRLSVVHNQIDRDIPAFKRVDRKIDEIDSVKSVKKVMLTGYDEEELDIPTFLRKKAD
ncbi:MAG: cell division protein FtsZ [bacterium]